MSTRPAAVFRKPREGRTLLRDTIRSIFTTVCTGITAVAIILGIALLIVWSLIRLLIGRW